jgi:DNA/RNA-binding domain of Phe-tRNA-synthetase-like protein
VTVSVRLAAALQPIVSIGALWLEGLTVVAREPRLDAAMSDAERQAPGVAAEATAAVRTMYRRIGLDPTKHRPSSEALARRVRRGEPLPRVNSLVDVCNWCSLELGIPYGLYDADRLRGEIELRVGRPGEQYAGIRKDVVRVEGRMTLADAQGPFGNPTSDSARTMVTTGTSRALAVVFMPRPIAPGRLARAVDLTAARVAEFCGGREIERLSL